MSAKPQKIFPRRTLAALRERAGLQQKQVAKILGVAPSVVSRYEAQDNPQLATLEAYVRALGGELHLVAGFPNEDGSVELTFVRTPSDPRKIVDRSVIEGVRPAPPPPDPQPQAARPQRAERLSRLDRLVDLIAEGGS